MLKNYLSLARIARMIAAGLLITSSSALADLNDGLVAYYPFNANANDESGHGNHGFASGATLTSDRFGAPNGAFQFDGTDFIRIPNSPSLALVDQLTIAVWFKFTTDPYSWPARRYSLVYKPEAWYGISYWSETSVRVSADQFLADITDEEGAVTQSILWQPGLWYHIVGTYDGQVSRIYVNGQLNNEMHVVKSLNTPNTDLTIGGENWMNWPAFNGVIDDVRIYNRALSAEEIALLKDADGPPIPPESPIVPPRARPVCSRHRLVSDVSNGPEAS